MPDLLCSGWWHTADYAAGAVHLDPIAVFEPGRYPAERHDGGQRHLTGHNRRVGQQATALHEQTSAGGKQHDPARVSALCDEDVALREDGVARVRDHAYRRTYDAWTTTN